MCNIVRLHGRAEGVGVADRDVEPPREIIYLFLCLLVVVGCYYCSCFFV